jgi:hypothetical protein
MSLLGTAGVPQSLAAPRDYDVLFARLKAAGITLFFPTFQTVEVPSPAGLGYEVDFAAPGPAYEAALRQGVQILLPASIVYPDGTIPRRLFADPLKKLLEAVGPGVVAGIFSWDEPVHQGVPLVRCNKLYTRVKQIDPNLPVVMVHAPRKADEERDWAAYFFDVIAYSQYADIAGFDVYPVTQEMMQHTSPAGAVFAEAHLTVRSYVEWWQANMPAKALVMVLQGFPQSAMYTQAWLDANATAEQIALARAPTAQETEAMLAEVAPFAMVTVWWGQSTLDDETMAPWPAMLASAAACACNG